MIAKLQFGVSFIEVSKQKLHITISHSVYNKTYSKEICPGVTPFSRAKGFGVFSSELWCLCSIPRQKSFGNSCKGLEEMLLAGVANKSGIVGFPPFCSHDRLTGSVFLLLFYSDRAIYWACAGKQNMVFSMYTFPVLFCDRGQSLCKLHLLAVFHRKSHNRYYKRTCLLPHFCPTRLPSPGWSTSIRHTGRAV